MIRLTFDVSRAGSDHGDVYLELVDQDGSVLGGYWCDEVHVRATYARSLESLERQKAIPLPTVCNQLVGNIWIPTLDDGRGAFVLVRCNAVGAHKVHSYTRDGVTILRARCDQTIWVPPTTLGSPGETVVCDGRDHQYATSHQRHSGFLKDGTRWGWVE